MIKPKLVLDELEVEKVLEEVEEEEEAGEVVVEHHFQKSNLVEIIAEEEEILKEMKGNLFPIMEHGQK